MKKLKIYLDTSVISHLHQDDVPEKMADTLKLWDEIKQEKYDVYLSDTTLEEIRKCSQPKLDILSKRSEAVEPLQIYRGTGTSILFSQLC